jgi:hypothetical protein
LLFSVSVCRRQNGNGSQLYQRVLKGHTKDVSMNSLALNVPQIHLDGHHLAAGGSELQLTLELPGGPISMRVIPQRYERIEEAELGCNYLIGAQISQIGDEDRLRYSSFVSKGLAGS